MSIILKNFDESETLHKHYLTLHIITNIRFINTTLSVASKDKSSCGKDNDIKRPSKEESLRGEDLSSTRLPDLTSLADKSWGGFSILKSLRKLAKFASKSSVPEKSADNSSEPFKLDSKSISKDSKGWRMAGDYPAEYNAAVHGPYDPSRFYGKPDTPFGQVKISELGSWFGRRNKSPKAVVAAVSRAYWRWQHKYVLPKRSTVAPFLQFISCAMVASYFLNYYKIKHHYYYKYH